MIGEPILAAGEQAVQSAQAKVQQTVDDIKAIPNRLTDNLNNAKAAAIQSVEDKKTALLLKVLLPYDTLH